MDHSINTQLDPQHRLIGIEVRLFGPAGSIKARLALDTGASSTVIARETLITIGYDPDALPKTVNFITRSQVESAARVTVDKLEAPGQGRPSFPVIAHTLPPTTSVDGLPGLDFLRNHVLILNFQNGEIALI